MLILDIFSEKNLVVLPIVLLIFDSKCFFLELLFIIKSIWNFYRSQDESPLARESTILVLSHLMSNDMIQTRGVLSEAARCICDPTRAVRDVAQSFFKELNSRTDTIIQLLPEFLYHLSNGNERMSFKSYKTVFEYAFLFGFGLFFPENSRFFVWKQLYCFRK